jgi:hypothetical protein
LPLPSPLAFAKPLDIRPPGFARHDQCGTGKPPKPEQDVSTVVPMLFSNVVF